MESYHVASNPRIRVVTRIDPPAARDDDCDGPYLVGCRAHAGAREVALGDCGRPIGCVHRMGGCRPVSWRGKYLSRNHREPSRGADHIVWFADPARCRRHRPVAVGQHRKAGLRDPAALARGGSGLSRRGRHFPRALG
jgi:hypothetical protein